MSQVLQRRKFVLYYPPEFVGGERVEIKVGMRFFTEENGFRLPEIGYINALKKGLTLSVGPLMIWRVR